jgi:hypothetical protein
MRWFGVVVEEGGEGRGERVHGRDGSSNPSCATAGMDRGRGEEDLAPQLGRASGSGLAVAARGVGLLDVVVLATPVLDQRSRGGVERPLSAFGALGRHGLVPEGT